MTLDLSTIVAALSIIGTLVVAGRLVFRVEARVEQLQTEATRAAKHIETCETAIVAFKVDHGANSTATGKDVEALKRDLDRLNETVSTGMANLSDRVHALSLALRSRSKSPGDSG